MKAIVMGRIYNTDTAEKVCELKSGWHGDSAYHRTALYRTRRGTFFLCGEGGPRSMWGESAGGGLCRPANGIRVIDAEEARIHMEAAQCSEEVYAAMGLELREG